MSKQDSVLRLAKPKRKGILGLIFSRFFIIVLLIIVELAVMVLPLILLNDSLHHFYVALAIFTLIMMIYLFNNKMDSTAKLTWMLIISVLQVPGALMLLFTQTNTGHRLVKERSERMISETKNAIPQDSRAAAKLREEDSYTDDLLTYLNRSGCFPAFAKTETTYFPSGEEKFQALLTELSKAEEYIFMEYFIIEEGYMWGKILEILTAKAKAGVDVRVMYDGMCEISTLPSNYCKLLQAEGIKAKSFAPIRPFISSHYNYRDHRKICVIDGKVAFNGGVNLADEYINEIERFGHWKDTAVMLKGDAVRSFTLMFLQMWNVNVDVKTADFTEVYKEVETDNAAEIHPSGYVIPFCDCPLDEDKVGEAVYMDILNRAGRYVHIMTPYLILDGELETALKYAGQRGIDVKLILPGIPDKKLAYSLAKSHYLQLLRAGVKIYEYTPGFVHAKVWTSDDEKGVVGTINLDYRSLYHHFECATYMYRTDCISDIERDFQDTLVKCRPVTEETIRGTEKFYKIVGPLAKLIAPLL
ncbi:MAG: cardiolipin synthase [Clostridiales bacterium]|nr:cardiolipin synthase [Clostridiales bacterium]